MRVVMHHIQSLLLTVHLDLIIARHSLDPVDEVGEAVQEGDVHFHGLCRSGVPGCSFHMPGDLSRLVMLRCRGYTILGAVALASEVGSAVKVGLAEGDELAWC